MDLGAWHCIFFSSTALGGGFLGSEDQLGLMTGAVPALEPTVPSFELGVESVSWGRSWLVALLDMDWRGFFTNAVHIIPSITLWPVGLDTNCFRLLIIN